MKTAFEKIMDTTRALRSPKAGAEGPELALAGITQGLSSPAGRGWLEKASDSGELDPFLHVLAVWLCAHRSDTEEMLLVVPVPRNRSLPAGTLLERVKRATQIAEGPPPNLIDLPDEPPTESQKRRDRQRVLINGLK